LSLRAAGLILLFLACLAPHQLSKWLLGRSRWPQRFLAAAAWIVGARCRVTGEPLAAHTLVIANHVTWLDILLLGGATGCAFVSKDNLGHPLVHWLADQHHTLYIHRSKRSATADQASAIAGALARAQPLALFPEGTTGPGDQLLPFRSALLAAVAPPPPGVTVRPVAIDYGPESSEVAWHGESARDNVLRILGRKGSLPVTLRLLPPLPPSADRKLLALDARERIGAALAASSSGRTGL
jgi:1-acyl-sn-glycerol-3-phosphate acyltransferase